MKKVLIPAIVILLLFGLGYYLWWGGKITTIVVTGSSEYEIDLQLKVTACAQQFKDRSYWLISQKQFISTIKKCDLMLRDVQVKETFPQKLEIMLSYYQPLIKLPSQENCELITDSEILKLPTDRCISYVIPVFKGVATLEGNPLLQFVEIASIELATQKIQYSEMEYKSDQTTASLTLKLKNNKLAYLPVSAELPKKIASLKSALDGLEEAKEKYSWVDLRFDRVVYK